MEAVTLPAGEGVGAVHYPMIASTLAGMELLGHLLGHQPITEMALEKHMAFDHYWKHFFSYLREEYKARDISQWIRSTLRNPLSHSFLTAINVSITKNRPEFHFRYYPIHNNSNDPFNIDCVELYHDLVKSYYEKVVPILKGVDHVMRPKSITRGTMQLRLDEMTAEFLKAAKKQHGKPTYPNSQSVVVDATVAPANIGMMASTNYTNPL